MRTKALTIIASQIVHVCPYKGRDVPLALCYRRAPDITDEYCYACDYVPYLKRKFGLRTFRRRIVLARCLNCDEYASLHEKEAPYRGTRVTTCQGFNPRESDAGLLWVALNKPCTEWMVVDAATGERRTEAEYRNLASLSPLVGAPGDVPSDRYDKDREFAANAAAIKREVQAKGNSKLQKKKDE